MVQQDYRLFFASISIKAREAETLDSLALILALATFAEAKGIATSSVGEVKYPSYL